jgi:hypothetical protein
VPSSVGSPSEQPAGACTDRVTVAAAVDIAVAALPPPFREDGTYAWYVDCGDEWYGRMGAPPVTVIVPEPPRASWLLPPTAPKLCMLRVVASIVMQR